MIYKNNDFIYDSETGGIIHARDKGRGGRFANKYSPCGDGGKGKYKYLYIRGKCIRYSDVIWEIVYGKLPASYETYYINGNCRDNRLCNIGIIDVSEKLVKRDYANRVWKRNGMWAAARLLPNKNREFIGWFLTEKEAREASHGKDK